MSIRPCRLFTPGKVFLPGLALVLLAGWLAPAPGSTPGPRPSTPAKSSARGREDRDVAANHFRRLCSRCHDDDLTGSVGREGGLAVPNFTSRHWQERRSDAQVLATILEGRGRAMPSFRGRLDEEDARALVVFLRQSAPDLPRQADTLSSAFQRRFAELQREMEELQRQSRALARPPRKPSWRRR
jgi:mono/diheme cytochrome c family protein